MAILPDAKWLTVSSELHKIIQQTGWEHISVLKREILKKGLASDIAEAESLYEDLSIEMQRDLQPEIKEATEALWNLLAGEGRLT